MPSYFTSCVIPYSQKQLYDLVADIESYPEFVPWCQAARIWDRGSDNVLYADLVIHFKGISGKYSSRVLLDEKDYEISVELAQGPFKHLYQGWKFIQTDDGTRVEFDIDFKMRSFVLEKIVSIMFEDTCEQMIEAFKKRADKIYHPSIKA